MPDKTTIANLALSRIGQKPINDIEDEDSPVARACSVLFEDVVREVARSHQWNCLKSRENLAQDATAPAFGWAYSYNMPTNCVRVVTVNGYDPIYAPDYFEIEGRKILTNDEECKLEYIAYKEDTTDYDILFTQAVVVLLAAYLASRIGQDDTLSQTLRREYEQVVLRRARKVDANEQKRRRYPMHRDSEWVQARFYNVTSSDATLP